MEFLEIGPQVGLTDTPRQAIPPEPGIGGRGEPQLSWPEALARLLPGGAAAHNGQPAVDQANLGALGPPAALPLPAAVFVAPEWALGEQIGPPHAKGGKPPVLPPWLMAAPASDQLAEWTSTSPVDLVLSPRVAGAVLAFDGAPPGRTETQSSDVPEAPSGLQELLGSLSPAGPVPSSDIQHDEWPLPPVPEGLRSWMFAAPHVEQSVSLPESPPAGLPVELAQVTLSPLSGFESPPGGAGQLPALDASPEAPPLVAPAERQSPVGSEGVTPLIVPLETGTTLELDGESPPPAWAYGQRSASSAARPNDTAARDSGHRPQAPAPAADGGESRAAGATPALPPPSAATGSAIPNNSRPPSEAAATAPTVTLASPTAGFETGPSSDAERADGTQPPRADAAGSSGPGVPTAGGRPEGTGRHASPPPSPAGPSDFADRLARTLVDSHQAGRPFSMRLHPPELGLLQIELSSRDGVFTARLDVETSAARQAILDQLPQLRDALAHTGHNVERIEIQVLERQDDRSQPHGERRESAHQRPRDDARREHDRTPRPEESHAAPQPHVRLRTTATMETLDIQI